MSDSYVPLTGPPAWRNAACRGEDPEMWFPLGERGRLSLNPDGENARDICSRCDYTGPDGLCVAEANRVDARYGIWGGLDPEQRARARRRRQRRPRRLRPDPDAADNLADLDDAITGWMP